MPPAWDHRVEDGKRNQAIALVNMPLGSATRPSIQLGLLSSIIESAGRKVDQYYFNVDLAYELGLEVYEELCRHRGQMTGEWLFSTAAFGSDFGPNTQDYLEQFPSEFQWLEGIRPSAISPTTLREQILPRFIERVADATDWSKYSIIGFTSTFQQNNASLALARRIKERFPQVLIVFGGSNTTDSMGVEVIRSFPYVDFVLRGEADKTFPVFVEWVFDGKQNAARISGLVSRNAQGTVVAEPEVPVDSINENPIPNYRPYFERVSALGFDEAIDKQIVVPFESSRGCWWGAKQHCTFCGLNGATMTFRKKSASVILAELKELASRHWVTNFEAVDNIVDHKQFDGLFDTIRDQRLSFRFFYEIKANISRRDLQVLSEAGVRSIQPGIESLNTRILRLMKKGSTVLHNVRCLKWAAYYKMGVMWNILFGFPGETSSDYASQLEVVRKVQHLQPPMSASRIWLERFAPYYKRQADYAISEVKPARSYSYVYPPEVNLADIAYFFDYVAKDTLADKDQEPLIQAVRAWRKDWAGPERHHLSYRMIGDHLLFDRGRGNEGVTKKISGVLSTIYLLCEDNPESPDRIVELLRAKHNYEIQLDDVRDILKIFCDHDLMLTDEGRYLALALPAV